MPCIFAYLILLIIIILAFIVAFKAGATWRSRFISWFFLFLPVALFMWDYPVIYYRHIQDCKAEGGLKVLIQPDKVDRVQFNPESYSGKGADESILRAFYPRLKLVETGIERYDNGRKVYDYFATSVTKTTDDIYKSDWTYNKEPISHLSEGMFVISKNYEFDESLHRSKDEWRLTRDGKLYAKQTQFAHFWTKIQYPDVTTSWSCEEEQRSDSNPYPYSKLMNLVLR